MCEAAKVVWPAASVAGTLPLCFPAETRYSLVTVEVCALDNVCERAMSLLVRTILLRVPALGWVLQPIPADRMRLVPSMR